MPQRPLMLITCRALASAIAMLATYGCGASTGSHFDFEQTAASVRMNTTPPEARVINIAAISRGEFHLDSSWEIESPSSWQEYTDAVRSRLPRDYEFKKTGAETAFFYKSLDRDSLTVEVKRISAGPPIRVQVTFRASAG